jgi:hypothetical protein
VILPENKAASKTSTDQYSSISLYLFILVFFIILSKAASSSDPETSINQFITQLNKLKNQTQITTNDDSNRNKVFFDNAAEIDDSEYLKSLQNLRLSKKYEWEKILDESGEFSKEFREKILEIKDYTETDIKNNNHINFLIAYENDKNIYEKTSKLIRFLQKIEGLKYQIQIDSKNLSNSIYIQLVSK